ncbi:MAG: membrane protein insertion efficiency factor YidD [Phycisphaeraceae bacterium]|nr:membrane protein insertion efficiency factor YidD [Phycisphaeraceae bacterium]
MGTFDVNPNPRRSPLQRLLAAPFVAAITLYRWTLSPFIGGHCRYFPSCSLYALDAYRSHGVFRATALTFGRLSRCHPWGGKGYDPVPEPRSRAVSSSNLSDQTDHHDQQQKSSPSPPDKNAALTK